MAQPRLRCMVSLVLAGAMGRCWLWIPAGDVNLRLTLLAYAAGGITILVPTATDVSGSFANLICGRSRHGVAFVQRAVQSQEQDTPRSILSLPGQRAHRTILHR